MTAFLVLGKYLFVLNIISLEIDQNFDLSDDVIYCWETSNSIDFI